MKAHLFAMSHVTEISKQV